MSIRSGATRWLVAAFVSILPVLISPAKAQDNTPDPGAFGNGPAGGLFPGASSNLDETLGTSLRYSFSFSEKEPSGPTLSEEASGLTALASTVVVTGDSTLIAPVINDIEAALMRICKRIDEEVEVNKTLTEYWQVTNYYQDLYLKSSVGIANEFSANPLAAKGTNWSFDKVEAYRALAQRWSDEFYRSYGLMDASDKKLRRLRQDKEALKPVLQDLRKRLEQQLLDKKNPMPPAEPDPAAETVRLIQKLIEIIERYQKFHADRLANIGPFIDVVRQAPPDFGDFIQLSIDLGPPAAVRQPNIPVRETRTTVKIADSPTLVIAGVIKEKDEEDQTPGILSILPRWFISGGIGVNVPLDDIELDPFSQAEQRNPNFGGMLEVGGLHPLDNGYNLLYGLRALFNQTDNTRLINLGAPGFQNNNGETKYYGVLPFVGLSFPVSGPWFGEVTGGVGWGHQDFRLVTGGVTVASASGDGWLGQGSIGVKRYLTGCLLIGVTGYLTAMQGIDGATNTAVPFRTGGLTDLAILSVLSYQFGKHVVARSTESSCR
ncbi:MAG: hypothetical protein K8F25_08380 [Fimbriimonadaceae bacterium]|nr:hypothetical protein [Alphaproteobacteria bacterium]